MKRYKKLVTAAVAALQNAYIPAGGTRRFGSAVLTNKGNIYGSGSYFSDTYSLTLHAEQAALAHAAAHGEHKVVAIASVSNEDPEKNMFCHPCGICKQLIFEQWRKNGRDIDVVMANENGEYTVEKISELVPYPWPQELP